MTEALNLLAMLLGLDRDVGDVNIGQTALRALLVYGAALAMVRLGSKRFPDPSRIRLAYLERDGRIRIVPANNEPRILDIAVSDGVQTVRIELR